MKYIILILAALTTSFQPAGDTYELLWADEFNKDGAPDPAKWSFEHGFVRNQEPQWYQPENASCKGGFLTIEAKKERKKNTRYDSSSKQWQLNREYAEYTSSCLISKGKFDFKYGKVTMRAKIDIRKGMWPAFWMLGTKKGGWPACGEVDIMEFYRGNLLANACWEGERGSAWDEAKWPVANMGGAAWADQFHEWQLIWDEKTMVITVDGKELNTTDLSKTINGRRGDNPFHENFFLLLNFALGQAGEEIPAENIPAKFIVDYVRVYQKK